MINRKYQFLKNLFLPSAGWHQNWKEWFFTDISACLHVLSYTMVCIYNAMHNKLPSCALHEYSNFCLNLLHSAGENYISSQRTKFDLKILFKKLKCYSLWTFECPSVIFFQEQIKCVFGNIFQQNVYFP